MEAARARAGSGASSGSSSGDGGEAVDFLDELDIEVAPPATVPAHGRRKSSAGSSLGDTTDVVSLDDFPAPAPASAPPSLPRGSEERVDDGGASAPDWLLMLRRVFEAARLSDVRLQRFVDRLGVMEYRDGATIVRQGEMGCVVWVD